MTTARLQLAAALLLLTTLPALAASTITGKVTDKTTNKPSAGDTVALISFGQGMQVAATTRSNAQGRYKLQVAAPGMHLIRVSHQNATYFQPAPEGTKTVNVDIYDVAEKVPGVTNEADVLSLQTGPSGELQVSEDFFVRNDSTPPKTQLSSHAYEFYLPEGAKLQGTAAMGPGGMPVESTPVPLAGPGHYAFVFPVRPGESRFQISYTLPYNGTKLGWTQREALPTENLVVILPKAMNFAPGSSDWKPVPVKPDAQTFVLKQVAADQPVAFSISGSGQLPREAQDANGSTAAPGTQNSPATSSSMQADTRPGGGLGPPVDTPDPLHKYKAWLLAGLGVLLLAGAFWLIRPGSKSRQRARKPLVFAPEVGNDADSKAANDAGSDVSREDDDSVEPPTHTPSPRPSDPAREIFATVSARDNQQNRTLRPLLERALLALEREHAIGIIPEPEYTESRAALQKTLHRALAREAAAEQNT